MNIATIRQWLGYRISRIIIATVCLLAGLVGLIVAGFNFGPRELAIFILFVLGVTILLMPTERILRIGFLIWIITFGFGWRTLYFTTELNIHPIEVLAYLLFGLVILHSVFRGHSINLGLPIPIVLLMVPVLLGLVVALENGIRSDVILQEFKNFLIIPVIYYLVNWFIRNRSDWERVINLTIVVITYVSLLGLMDYFLPNLSRSLANNPNIPTLYTVDNYAGTSSFARVGFIFYGNFLAGFLILTFFGFTVHHLLENLGKHKVAIVYALLILVQLFAMYLSGYRGLWYAIIVFSLAYALLRGRALILLITGLVVIPFLSRDFFSRFISIFVSG